MFGLLLISGILLVGVALRLLKLGGRLLNEPPRKRARVKPDAAGPFRSSEAPPVEIEVWAEGWLARGTRLLLAIAILALSVVLMGAPLLLPMGYLYFLERSL